jgi:gamma-glutamyltranspeptidase
LIIGLCYYFKPTLSSWLYDTNLNGMVFVLTSESTVNLVFGLQVLQVDPETGIIFNDLMDDFSSSSVYHSTGYPKREMREKMK